MKKEGVLIEKITLKLKMILGVSLLASFVIIGGTQLMVYGAEVEVETESVDQQELTFRDVFPDENLAIYMSRELGYGGNVDVPITIQMLNDFQGNQGTLGIRSNTIRDLEGLQHLISINNLNLTTTNVRNFSQVGQLTNTEINFQVSAP